MGLDTVRLAAPLEDARLVADALRRL